MSGGRDARLVIESTTEEDEDSSMEPAGMTQNMMFLGQRLRTMLREEQEPGSAPAAGSKGKSHGGAADRVSTQLGQLDHLESRFQFDTDESSDVAGSSSVRRVYEFIDLDGSTSTEAGMERATRVVERGVLAEKGLPQRPPEENVAAFSSRTNQASAYIHPFGVFWQLWSIMLGFFSLYEILIVPIIVGWDYLNHGGIFFTDYVVTTFFIIDIVLSFWVARVSKNFYLETDRVRIVLGYAWTWFLMDFVATFPFDVVIWLGYSQDARNFARLLKLLHVFRFYRAVHTIFQRVRARNSGNDESVAAVNTGLERVIGLVVAVFVLSHWAGCMFITHGKSVGFGVTSFVPPARLRGATFGSQYLHGLHWAFYSLIGPDRASHLPSETGEYFFSAVMGLLFLFVILTLIAQLVSLWRALDSQSSSWNDAAQAVNRNAKQDSLRRWAEAMLGGERFLEGVSPDTIRALATEVRLLSVPANVAVVREGRPPASSLFMVYSGVVEQSKSGIRMAYRGRNASFNSEAILNPDINAAATVHAVEPTQLAVLSRDSLWQVAAMHRDLWDLLQDSEQAAHTEEAKQEA